MMSKKGIKIKQFDITDCGAACLASVCAYYGLQFPLHVSANMRLPIKKERIFWG